MRELIDDLEEFAVARSSSFDHIFAAPAASKHLQTSTRSKTLPAAAPSARARWAVGLHDDMTNLAGKAVGAALQATAHHDTTADARAKRDQHNIVEPTSSTVLPFSERCTRCVIVDRHGKAQSIAHRWTNGELISTCQIGSSPQHARSGDESGHAYT